jgi:hypothetical protein
MKHLIITLVLSLRLFANNLYWYSDNSKVKIYNIGYSNIYNSVKYGSSQNIKTKQIVSLPLNHTCLNGITHL